MPGATAYWDGILGRDRHASVSPPHGGPGRGARRRRRARQFRRRASRPSGGDRRGAARWRRELGAPSASSPSSRIRASFFQPDQPPFRLTPLPHQGAPARGHRRRLPVRAALRPSWRRKSAEAFVVEVLSEGLDAAHVVVGYDFVFGQGRSGNAALLADLGRAAWLRRHVGLAAGDAAGRGLFLDPGARASGGRPIRCAAARCSAGPGRSRAGSSTATSSAAASASPPPISRSATICSRRSASMRSRPASTRGAAPRWHRRRRQSGPAARRSAARRSQLEVHLFDFDGDLYGRHLRVALIDYHPAGDRSSTGCDALKAQIAADCDEARRMLAAYAGPAPGAVPPLRAGRGASTSRGELL